MSRMDRAVKGWVTGVLILISGCSGTDGGDFTLTEAEGMETVAVLETNQGPVSLRFFPDKAPKHVQNFVNLCGQGFFDETAFHRVAPGYLVQGGDPGTREGNENSEEPEVQEFSFLQDQLEPEFNDLPFTRGIVGMSRGDGPDSSPSQFFIMLAEDASLNGRYTAFAEVVEGMDALDWIGAQKGEAYPEVGGVSPSERQILERCILEDRPIQEGPDVEKTIPEQGLEGSPVN